MNELEAFLPPKKKDAVCEYCGGTGKIQEDAGCPNCYGTGHTTKPEFEGVQYSRTRVNLRNWDLCFGGR